MGRTRTDPRYVYDVRLLQYRDTQTGRIVKQSTVEQVVEDRITDGFETLKDYAAAIIDGNAGSVADFETAFLTELRNSHAQCLMVGKGGRANVTQADWGRLGSVLRSEYGFARGLIDDIVSGRVSRAQMEARLDMYANKVYHSFWNGKTSQARESGFDQERRVLRPAEHCDPCVDYAAMGWQPIGTMPDPADGSTPCGSRDKCGKQYRNSRTGVIVRD